jgi:hypothetical protein
MKFKRMATIKEDGLSFRSYSGDEDSSDEKATDKASDKIY